MCNFANAYLEVCYSRKYPEEQSVLIKLQNGNVNRETLMRRKERNDLVPTLPRGIPVCSHRKDKLRVDE